MPALAGAVWTVFLDGLRSVHPQGDRRGRGVWTACDRRRGLADAINRARRLRGEVHHRDVKLTGTPTAGDVWTVKLDTQSVTYRAGGDTLQNVAAGLETAIERCRFTATTNETKVTLSRATAFAIKLTVQGTNLQSTGQVSGTTGGSRLIVFTTDSTPFSVEVRLAQSASQADNFAVGGTLLAPASSASVRSTTHYSSCAENRATALRCGAAGLQGTGGTWVARGRRVGRTSRAARRGEKWSLR